MSTILLDPTDERTPAQRQRLPRPVSLKGLRVGLLDISKVGGDVFLDRVEERLAETGCTVERFAKPTFARVAPVDLKQLISTQCDVVIEALAERGVEIRYDAPPAELTALERDLMEMEAELQAARLLTWRAASLISQRKPNNLEASMAKAKAGPAVTRITQKAVALMGPAGYSKNLLLEKWMRDAKINDIYEGTQQINQLIVARRILNYPSSMLR